MRSLSSGFFSRALFLFLLLPVLLVQGGVPASASPGAATPAATAGRIIYLAADGVTIKSIRPDGTGVRTLYTARIPKGYYVSDMSTDPTGAFILYGIISNDDANVPEVFYLLHNGVAKKLPPFMLPRWSPDGKRFVAEVYSDGVSAGSIYIYNVTNGTSLFLKARGTPDWYPDGTRLVYTDGGDIFSYNRATTVSTKLTNLPHQETGNDWEILEAHVVPAGNRIVFFGQEFRKDGQIQVGASGNGLQWYSLPMTGGTPQPWLDIEGNYLVAYAASSAGNKIAYSGSAHDSACASIQSVNVVDAGRFPGKAVSADIPNFDPDNDKLINIVGLSFSPSGKQVAYGALPYTCNNAVAAPATGTSSIYTWDATSTRNNTPVAHKLVNGSYPVWVK